MVVDDGGEPLIDRKFIMLPGMTPKPGQLHYFEAATARPEYKELVTGIIDYPTKVTVEKGELIVTSTVVH